jgi:opine dehydrogenase
MIAAEKAIHVTVLGAGPAGTATAALAASRGHQVTLWSPRGGGTRHIGAAIRVHGLLEGEFAVRVAADIGRAVEAAEAVLVMVPGHVQPQLLERLARVLHGRPSVLVTPPNSLSPMLLERMLAPRGITAEVGGLAAPPVAARRLDDGRLWLGAIRPRLWLGADFGGQRLAQMATSLFGRPVRLMPGLLAASLADLSGLGEAALLLAPPGGQEAPLRLLARLTAERDAVAAALRLTMPEATGYFGEIGGLPPLDAERAMGQGGMALSFLATLGAATRTPVPMTEASLRLLEVFCGQPMRANKSLTSLGEAVVRGVTAAA